MSKFLWGLQDSDAKQTLGCKMSNWTWTHWTRAWHVIEGRSFTIYYSVSDEWAEMGGRERHYKLLVFSRAYALLCRSPPLSPDDRRLTCALTYWKAHMGRRGPCIVIMLHAFYSFCRFRFRKCCMYQSASLHVCSNIRYLYSLCFPNNNFSCAKIGDKEKRVESNAYRKTRASDSVQAIWKDANVYIVLWCPTAFFCNIYI